MGGVLYFRREMRGTNIAEDRLDTTDSCKNEYTTNWAGIRTGGPFHWSGCHSGIQATRWFKYDRD